MNAASAIREGFRAVSRQPALVLSEIAWRWSFAGAAWLLIALTGFEYLGSLTVSQADMLLLRTRHPALVGRAISDIFRDSGARLAEGTVIVVLALLVFWIAAASIGEFVMLRALLPPLSTRQTLRPRTSGSRTFRSLLGINFLRASLAFAAVLAGFSGMVLAGLIDPTNSEDLSIAANLFLVIVMIVWLLWSGLNWLLSLAIVSGEDTFGSISGAVDLLRRSSSAITGVSGFFAFVHTFAFLLSGTAFFGVIGVTTQISHRAAALLLLIIALAYFAFVDFLHIVRLAAYAAIAQSDPQIPTAFTAPEFPLFSESQPAN